MLATSLMAPVFVQVLLTFVVIIWVGRTRRQSLRDSRTSLNKREVALGQHQWSDAATQAAANFRNQFEMPVLFYVGVAFALILRKTDYIRVTLAWIFVLTRLVHAFIHLGPNVVKWRGVAYIIGVVVLMAFWIMLFLRIFADQTMI